MKKQKFNTKNIQEFNIYQLQSSYLILITGGDKRLGGKADEDVE